MIDDDGGLLVVVGWGGECCNERASELWIEFGTLTAEEVSSSCFGSLAG